MDAVNTKRIIREVIQEYLLTEAQKFTSARTSINGNKLPSMFTIGSKRGYFKPGTRNFDMGGGKFDNATEFLKNTHEVENLIYDPFNRSEDWNKQVMDAVMNGGADTVTCNNVLNVIDDDDVVLSVIKQCADVLKPEGVAYFQVYEGNKSGTGRQTGDDQWQRNQTVMEYIPFIKEYFNEVKKGKGGAYIIASNPKQD